ncbi:hypothetical protein OJ997_03835 [Solirubrobacter phytolaccae]|uniref:Uncharacterized protein n=1 Tax=Solirubrobacter phytolaccae TaxID=1404360 RepID=A0A9X3N6M4_9ACTN|nr:hypothetical protein [Solirubrobacter phytolaccae]MDA0179415.1 hypothetical protein [Solirubrobacter phytolaccae]
MVGIALAIGAPAAHGATFDVPYPPVPAGVSLKVTSTDEVRMRFGPKAVKTWRAVAGKRAQMACVTLAPVHDDVTTLSYSAIDGRVPKTGRVVNFGFEARADLCTIATRGHPSFDGCLRLLANDTWCVRVVAPLTDAGRAYLDAFARTAELSAAYTALEAMADFKRDLDATVVALPNADAAPPSGQIGIFAQGPTTVIATALADGRRRFVRLDANVYSTNDIRLPGNLEKLTFVSIRGRF